MRLLLLILFLVFNLCKSFAQTATVRVTSPTINGKFYYGDKVNITWVFDHPALSFPDIEPPKVSDKQVTLKLKRHGDKHFSLFIASGLLNVNGNASATDSKYPEQHYTQFKIPYSVPQGSDYYFQVYVSKWPESTSYRSVNSYSFAISGPRPSIPSHLRFVNSTTQSITFRWDDVRYATGYKILNCATNSSTDVSENSITVDDLEEGNVYQFKVAAHNEIGEFSGYSACYSFATQSPPPEKPNKPIGDTIGVYEGIDRYYLDSIPNNQSTEWVLIPDSVGTIIQESDTSILVEWKNTVRAEALLSAKTKNLNGIYSPVSDSLKVHLYRPFEMPHTYYPQGSQYFLLDSVFLLHFNFEIAKSNENGMIRLYSMDDEIVDSLSFSALSIKDDSVLEFQLQNLKAESNYYVTIDSNTLVDLSGNPFKGIKEKEWVFKTAPDLFPPSDFFVTAISTEEVKLQWKSDAKAEVHEVFNCKDSLLFRTNNDSLVISGLRQNKDYYFKVRSIVPSSQDTSKFSNCNYVKTNLALPLPPKVLFLKDVSFNSFEIAWNADMTDYIESYQVYLDDSLIYGEWADTTFKFEGLDLGEDYRVVIKSKNSTGVSTQESEILVSTLCAPTWYQESVEIKATTSTTVYGLVKVKTAFVQGNILVGAFLNDTLRTLNRVKYNNDTSFVTLDIPEDLLGKEFTFTIWNADLCKEELSITKVISNPFEEIGLEAEIPIVTEPEYLLTSIQPNFGFEGDTVTIRGNQFTQYYGSLSFFIGDVKTNILDHSDSLINIIIPKLTDSQVYPIVLRLDEKVYDSTTLNFDYRILDEITEWNDEGWSNGTPHENSHAIIRSNNPVTSFITKRISIDEGYTLNIVDGETIELIKDIANEGEGIFGGTVLFNSVKINTPLKVNSLLLVKDSAVLETNDYLYLLNGSSLIHQNDDNLIGEIVAERMGNEAMLAYNFWSLPIKDSSQVKKVGGLNHYIYNESEGWEITPSSILPAQGFISTGSGLVQVKGRPYANNVSIDVTYQGDKPEYKGYNLIGNPFLAPLDYDQFIANNPVIENGTIYLYKGNSNGTGNYLVVNSLNKKAISSFQGFFIRVKQDSSIQFLHSQKVQGKSLGFVREAKVTFVKLELTDGYYQDEIQLVEGLQYSDLDDYGLDALKFSGDQPLQLGVLNDHNDKQYSVLAKNHFKGLIPLKIQLNQKSESDTYLRIKDGAQEYFNVFLIIKETGETINLSKIKEYKIDPYLAINNNYFLRIRNSDETTVVDIDVVDTDHQITITPYELKIANIANSLEQVSVFDIRGIVLFDKSYHNANNNYLIERWHLPMNTPLFFVIVSKKGTVTKKIIFNEKDN